MLDGIHAAVVEFVAITGIIAIAIATLLLRDRYLWKIAPRRSFRNLERCFRDRKFTVFACPPFAVITDEEEEDVKGRLEWAVAWVIENLENIGLRRHPYRRLNICLFKDWKNYQDCAEWVAGRKQLWTGGNFIGHCNTVVADISGGDGVLVHEIVHAFVHANLPKCPVWLDEGLASFLTGCSEDRNGTHRHREYAAREMRAAIREKRALSLETLCGLSFRAFHIDDEARNYAQSACLCYYLRDRGVLSEYCRAFCCGRRRDPTGYRTLKKVLGHEDLKQLQKDWEAFVLRVKGEHRTY